VQGFAVDVVLADARQKPAPQGPQEDAAEYDVPPALKVPVGQGFAVAVLVAEGQK